jgi:hypothetical protein
MSRPYGKIEYASWNRKQTIEEAIAADDYIKTYFLEDGRIGRIDYSRKGKGLVKISYRECELPDESLLGEHLANHPGVLCEIASPKSRSLNGGWIVTSRLYEPSGALDRRYELYYDDGDRLLRSIKLTANGDRVLEERPLYDDNGITVGMELYNASGKLINIHDYTEW